MLSEFTKAPRQVLPRLKSALKNRFRWAHASATLNSVVLSPSLFSILILPLQLIRIAGDISNDVHRLREGLQVTLRVRT
jgi:hypothetical protein